MTEREVEAVVDEIREQSARMNADLSAAIVRARVHIIARVLADARGRRDREQLARLSTYGGGAD